MAVPEIRSIDRAIYTEELATFLPKKVIDIHAHVWKKEFEVQGSADERFPMWSRIVTKENPIQDLLGSYRVMLPEQEVTPLIFGWPEPDLDQYENNKYVGRTARENHLPGLLVSKPEWSGEEVERMVRAGEFLGLKPYPKFAPRHIAFGDITIFDYLPHHQLEIADDNAWAIMLHIPRAARLRDPINLQQLIELEQMYPRVKLVIAHIGRAFCDQDVGDAFQILRVTQKMVFDFSANTNARVMERLIRAMGPHRVLFGSDQPIANMRMRRVCEDGFYVNLVPPGVYLDIALDPHLREISHAEGEMLSFSLYEELRAFRDAARATNLSPADVTDVFYNNGARVINL